MLLYLAFVVFIGVVYVLGKGLAWAMKRLGVSPAVEAVVRMLLGTALAVGFIFILKALER
jgi:hypothetical protein